MGMQFEFKCNTCGYKACVSDGPDRGAIAIVQPMICTQCLELSNVLIEYDLGPHNKSQASLEEDSDMRVCDKCKGKDLIEWDNSKPCPRCEGTMIRNDSKIILWD